MYADEPDDEDDSDFSGSSSSESEDEGDVAGSGIDITNEVSFNPLIKCFLSDLLLRLLKYSLRKQSPQIQAKVLQELSGRKGRANSEIDGRRRGSVQRQLRKLLMRMTHRVVNRHRWAQEQLPNLQKYVSLSWWPHHNNVFAGKGEK